MLRSATGGTLREGRMMKAFASLLLLCSTSSGCGPVPPAPPGTAAQAAPQAPGGTNQQNVSAGTWTGSLTYKWSEAVDRSGGGAISTASQSYEATVQIGSQAADTDAWTLIGEATIAAARTIDFEQTIVSSLGSCTEKHHDEAIAKGKGQIEGGLEISDDSYQFTVRLPVVAGSETSVRTYSGCGTKTTNTDIHDWPTSPITTGGSGTLTKPNAISGSSSATPGTTVVWSLTRR
jgi:hypothetical protein